ncbi:MAG: 3-oxoacyl-ACP reductase FabG [Clostridia bacterium]|nr:3-oxoacyl-ACP reductase FabG [Clostridia bacterium]
MSKKKVIITGGSRGIGAECVRAFSALGDEVVFIYKNSDIRAAELCRETGARAVKADLSAPDSAKNAVAEAMALLGGADVLVNNAGIAHVGLFNDITKEAYNHIMDTNLSSAVFCSQAVLDDMIHKKRGRIINVSSMWGEVGASCEVVYSASKAALIGFTKALAKELGPSGITVNCVSPGVIDTEMNASLTQDALTSLAQETPLCRIGKAKEVADTIVYLASDSAAFITGQVLGVNGGMVV